VCIFKEGTDYAGGDIRNLHTPDKVSESCVRTRCLTYVITAGLQESCCEACTGEQICAVFSYRKSGGDYDGQCFLKSIDHSGLVPERSEFVSGKSERAWKRLRDTGTLSQDLQDGFARALEQYEGCSLMPPRPTPSLMIMVLSGCDNVERRRVARAMMQRANFTNYKFLLGDCTGSDEEHGDLVHANITDTYKTSSKKLLLGMELMLQRWDFEWLMKVDDDVLIHFGPLLHGLSCMPRVLCRNAGGSNYGSSEIGTELPLWWATFRRGHPITEHSKNSVDGLSVKKHLFDGQWPAFGWGAGHVMNRGGVQQIVKAKDRWMGFAESSGVWMEDVAFGMWFESLKMSCRIHDHEFTQFCDGDNAITSIDGLNATLMRDCSTPGWFSGAGGMAGMGELGSVVCGTTAQAFANVDAQQRIRGGTGAAVLHERKQVGLVCPENPRALCSCASCEKGCQFCVPKKAAAVVALYGVAGRDHGCAWPSQDQNLVGALQGLGYTVDILRFELVPSEGDLVDGAAWHAANTSVLPCDYYRSATFREADAAVQALCNKAHSGLCKYMGSTNATYALRQLYSESRVGQMLQNHSRQYDVAVVLGSNIYLPRPLEAVDVATAAREDSREVFVSKNNGPQGITSGFYVGHPTTLLPILMRLEQKKNGIFPEALPQDYDQQLLRSFQHNKMQPKVLFGYGQPFKSFAMVRYARNHKMPLFSAGGSFWPPHEKHAWPGEVSWPGRFDQRAVACMEGRQRDSWDELNEPDKKNLLGRLVSEEEKRAVAARLMWLLKK
jgi:hypothetical protein